MLPPRTGEDEPAVAPDPSGNMRPSDAPGIGPGHAGPDAEEVRWNLGFIAPFEHLNPDLPDALRRLAERNPVGPEDLRRYQRPAGMERHRAAGSAWARRYGVKVSPEDLLICAGSQHALLTILTSLCKPGDRIAAEQLSYPLLRRLARRLRLGVVPVRADECGMLPEALENACRAGGVRALYLMPSCQNPTLARIPAYRRQELVEVCRRHDILIIEDDVFALALPHDRPLTPFAGLAPERTCFIAATSEILGGGLRVAYLCPPQFVLEELERTISYTISMVPPLMAELATLWMEDGTADRVLAAKREEAAARNDLARSILDGFRLETRPTGFFCWLRLPAPWTGIAFADAARRRGVLTAEGEHFMMGHAMPENGVRLALGGMADRAELARALERLAELLHSRKSDG